MDKEQQHRVNHRRDQFLPARKEHVVTRLTQARQERVVEVEPEVHSDVRQVNPVWGTMGQRGRIDQRTRAEDH